MRFSAIIAFASNGRFCAKSIAAEASRRKNQRRKSAIVALVKAALPSSALLSPEGLPDISRPGRVEAEPAFAIEVRAQMLQLLFVTSACVGNCVTFQPPPSACTKATLAARRRVRRSTSVRCAFKSDV